MNNITSTKDLQKFVVAGERAEAIAGIQRGLDSVKRGEGEPASKAFARIRRKPALSSAARRNRIVP